MGLSAASGVYFFTPPYRSWAVDLAGGMAVTGFLLGSAVTVAVVWRLQRASTALARSHERLALSESRLQAVIDGQTEMLFRFGRDGRFLFANDVGLRTFGLSAGSTSSLTWHALVPADQQADVTRRLRAMTPAHPTVRTETRLSDMDGGARWGEFVHHASFDARGRLQEVQTVGRDITQRHQLQQELATMSASLQDLYDHAPCGYYSVDREGRFVRINATLLGWLGCTADEVLHHRGPKDFFTPASVQRFDENFPTFLAQGHIGPLEFELQGRDGSLRRVSMTATAVRGEDGQVAHSRSVMHDVTELHQVRQALQTVNRTQAAMLDNELIGIVRLKDRRAVWCNRALAEVFGYGPGELDGQPARLLYLDDASYEALGAAAYPELSAGRPYRTQLRMRRRDGSVIWVDMSGALVSPEQGESMWMMLDITAMKEHAERVQQAALHDALTGLPNRSLLSERLDHALTTARSVNTLLAVCLVDLDGFKAVNDQHGHAAGDELLQVIARRLQDGVRGHDTVARQGGDEFVLLLTRLQNRQECGQILSRLLASVAEPVPLPQGATARVSASIGIAYAPDDARDAEALLKLADRAMYDVKRGGKNAFVDSGVTDERKAPEPSRY